MIIIMMIIIENTPCIVDLPLQNGEDNTLIIRYWLVVWNMNFMTFHSVGNFIIPTDELMFFRGVGIPPTRLS
jgi:hypothetical protein